MSKVSIEFDTKTDELVVKVDGKEIAGVTDVSIYSYKYREGYEDELETKTSISITTTQSGGDDDDLRTVTHLCAAYKDDIIANKPKNTAKLYKDIQNYLEGMKK